MSSAAAIVCREIFDENSQPSAEEISEYAQQLGIDPDSESHLLPLAKDGLMQALPTPWKAYFDEKLQTHYYYNDETKKTQWEHPLDNVYRELVKKARDASVLDDTCASVQDLLTSEENTKLLERIETKVESDEELSTDSGEQNDSKETTSNVQIAKRLAPLGRPPLAPLSRLDRKLGELRVSPLRSSIDNTVTPKQIVRNSSGEITRSFERPKMLFKQHSEIIDLKMHVLNSPEEENFSPLLSMTKVEKGLPLTGKGSMFLKASKTDLPSPDTEKSLLVDSITKSDPPKGILREKISDTLQRKSESITFGKPKVSSFEEDKRTRSVRFKLETLPDPTVSPGSNSSSEQNDGQSSIISATPATVPSPIIPSSPTALSPITVPLSTPVVLSPLISRPPLPPRPQTSLDSLREKSISEKDSVENDNRVASPKRRLLRPPATEYIKPELFQKNFQKISDLVRPGDIDTEPINLDVPASTEKEAGRPRSPMIPQKNKISINLMESIESETSIDSPDADFANFDLNDVDNFSDSKNSESKNDKVKESTDLKLSDEERVSNYSKSSSPRVKESTDFKLSDDERVSNSKSSSPKQIISPRVVDNVPAPQIKIPKLDLLLQSKHVNSDSDDSKKTSIKDEFSKTSKTNSVESKDRLKISPTPSFGAELRSPRTDFIRPWSNSLSPLKPLNKAVIAPIKSESTSSIKSVASPRLDGVILSQGKSSSDNVVVLYQFDSQEEVKQIKSPIIPDMARDLIERNKADERRRLELNLQKELECIRAEWAVKEKNMRVEFQKEIDNAEERFSNEIKTRLFEQAERHKKEIDAALLTAESNHKDAVARVVKEFEERYKRDIEKLEKEHNEKLQLLRVENQKKLFEHQKELEIENSHALSEVREKLSAELNRERTRIIEENKDTVEALREEHSARINDLKQDYRAEVDRLRSAHACHLQELRTRVAGSRLAGRQPDQLQDKYKCLKEKYARLKHDVKMSIERRNKRREMSMATGSETEKSNSNKANQSLERCKEVNETSVSAVIEHEPTRVRINNNQINSNIKYNDNETSYSESNAQKSLDNNNDDWKLRRENNLLASDTSQTSGPKQRTRRATVAFREPLAPRRRRDRDREANTDFQDSSDATTADEKPKESINGHGRRRHFTRLKSASTSRLNYSPKRGEGWSSPLEALRQQLRKLDDLEDQFPDLACQPAYSLRYPFAELGAVSSADAPELEFVRHRALIEREGMRRARAVLKRRKAALKEARASLSPHRAPSEEREVTELEVGLLRARALLGEKEIRLRHIERALRHIPYPPQPQATHPAQELTTSEVSSGSSAEGNGEDNGVVAGGAVLRSLRALHEDVRDIWRALDARRPNTMSPETSSYNAPPASQTRMTISAPEPNNQDNSDNGVAERARGLRAWLQTAP